MSAALKVSIDGGPYALAAGPDGAMWVTLVHSGAIARVTNGGDLTVYPVGPQSRPSIITAGPDGAMWFTRAGDDRIGRITMAGELTAFELAEGSGPFGITAGPDGALWFTGMTSGEIGRISVHGELSGSWPVGGAPSMIVSGPDNALWLTLNQANAVGRLAPADGLTVRELPTAAAGPVSIAATHDDAVWFTEILADKLGRIPMDDAIQEMDLPGKPHAVVADPDDGVWVSLWGANQIRGSAVTARKSSRSTFRRAASRMAWRSGPTGLRGSRWRRDSCCACPSDWPATRNSAWSHSDKDSRTRGAPLGNALRRRVMILGG